MWQLCYKSEQAKCQGVSLIESVVSISEQCHNFVTRMCEFKKKIPFHDRLNRISPIPLQLSSWYLFSLGLDDYKCGNFVTSRNTQNIKEIAL